MADPMDFLRRGLDAQKVRVEALGEPGQRRFRLLASVEGETHIVWMEKQQLQALGLALEQMLEQIPDQGPTLDETDVPLDFDTETRHQFRVGRMELGYDEAQDRIVMIAHDMQEPDAVVQQSLHCRLTRGQVRTLVADAAMIVSAGRPRCPMCGAPMDSESHVCPQQNGHLPLAFEGVEADEDEGAVG